MNSIMTNINNMLTGSNMSRAKTMTIQNSAPSILWGYYKAVGVTKLAQLLRAAGVFN